MLMKGKIFLLFMVCRLNNWVLRQPSHHTSMSLVNRKVPEGIPLRQDPWSDLEAIRQNPVCLRKASGRNKGIGIFRTGHGTKFTETQPFIFLKFCLCLVSEAYHLMGSSYFLICKILFIPVKLVDSGYRYYCTLDCPL